MRLRGGCRQYLAVATFEAGGGEVRGKLDAFQVLVAQSSANQTIASKVRARRNPMQGEGMEKVQRDCEHLGGQMQAREVQRQLVEGRQHTRITDGAGRRAREIHSGEVHTKGLSGCVMSKGLGILVKRGASQVVRKSRFGEVGAIELNAIDGVEDCTGEVAPGTERDGGAGEGAAKRSQYAAVE